MNTTKSVDEMVAEAVAAYDLEDFAGAKALFTPLAIQSNAIAQNGLGILYYYGQGVDKDIKQAIDWFRKAAEQGLARAQCNMGNFYGDGEVDCVAQNDAEAAVWYAKAAEQGYIDAQYSLGHMYYFGKGLEQNYKLAREWFVKAAEQGNSDSQLNLAIMLRDGEGGEINESMSVEWFEKAAVQGNAQAQHSIATCYQSGKGVIQDDEQAAVWMHKSAEHGHAGAQYLLAQMFEYGKGVVIDTDKANFWYGCAADQGIKKPAVEDLVGHFILLKHYDRQRFGYVFLLENLDVCCFREVDDGEARMPVAKVELENVLVDYGRRDGVSEKDKLYYPWFKRIIQCGENNEVTGYRAALIATGDLVLSGANEELVAQLLAVQSLRGSELTAWSDEEINIAIQLSRQEEARSIVEIAQRLNLAKLIAEQINSNNNSEKEQDLLH